ncbi:MAG TPA: glycosyltransferase family protein [Spirochaetia bacterium]|nr:glycosyltransferase family protein [Spirochaetia bacterium]HRZ64642.1 glycosyltransferase family protein [Spirochaetia bacterium]
MSPRKRLRIAISVNGEGRGHLTRIAALARRLEGRQELAFWAPDTILEELGRLFPRAEARPVPLLRIAMRGPGIDLAGTAAANLGPLVSTGSSVSALAAELEAFRPDGVLSDFEPFLPEAAARLGLPVLQLNHPGILTRFPLTDPASVAAKLVAARMMGRFDKLLLCSFYAGDVGPILRPELLRARRPRREEDFVLVYAREGLAERFRDYAARRGATRFRFFPDPASDYASALASCSAIVAPAGHQTICEALCLGKPIFAVPLAGQAEQALNAQMLRRSGWGDWAPAEAFEEGLDRFLAARGSYPRPPEPGLAFRFGDEGPRAARIVRDYFAAEAARLRGPAPIRRAYSRATWFLGRLVPAGGSLGAPA